MASRKRSNEQAEIFVAIRRTIQQFDAGDHQGVGELAMVLSQRVESVLDKFADSDSDDETADEDDTEYEFDAESEEEDEE